jgi:hypothetical protein
MKQSQQGQQDNKTWDRKREFILLICFFFFFSFLLFLTDVFKEDFPAPKK